MKILKAIPLFVGTIFFLGSTDIFAETQTGDIIGTVKTCSYDEIGIPVDFGQGAASLTDETSLIIPPDLPSSSVTVYIPGLSFVVKTGTSNSFKLLNVPQGTYDLAFEDIFFGGSVPHIVDDIEVHDQEVTDVGEIDICQHPIPTEPFPTTPFPTCTEIGDPACVIMPPCDIVGVFGCTNTFLPAK